MSAYIPHLLTRLLTESECDELRDEFLTRANLAVSPAHRVTWTEAAELLDQRRTESLATRFNQTPSARRKSLGYRTRSATAH